MKCINLSFCNKDNSSQNKIHLTITTAAKTKGSIMIIPKQGRGKIIMTPQKGNEIQ
jgi:hypothetical protein